MSDEHPASPTGPFSSSKMPLGVHVPLVGAISWEFVTAVTPNGAVLMTRIEHAGGATVFSVIAEDAERFFQNGLNAARKAQGKPTGQLAVATKLDLDKLR